MSPGSEERLRRTLDVTAAGAGLLLLTPLLVLLAALVRVTSGRGILFRQWRVGRNGVPFLLLKLRTMHANAEARGPAITVGADPRVTSLGAILRRYKLDELPQLWNVLRGDMSLVGPRPEVPRYVAGYGARERAALRVRPGLTDPASLAFRDESALLASFADPERAYLEEILPRKLRISLEYLAERDVRSDLAVIAKTALCLLRPVRCRDRRPGA